MGGQGALAALVVKDFGSRYDGARVLLTGHTGFKGGWLALWLNELGAQVTGLALDPVGVPNHWGLLDLDVEDLRIDLTDREAVTRAVSAAQPEIVFHLAAQALVRRSYRDPVGTWSVNVMGLVHLLEACRATPSVRAIVVVTSDKCYENREWPWGYRESDPLGGHDPYSASKGAAELVAASYRNAFFNAPDAPLIATARAGNVIGGGDWSEDRLIPDLVRAVAAGTELVIRSPAATRPWQHVLESLSGYLLLGAELLGGGREYAAGWNFGPAEEGNRSVADVLGRLATRWPAVAWRTDPAPQPHEATLLYLDSAKARHGLGWRPVWSLDEGLAATADWYRAFLEDGRLLTRAQLHGYRSAARGAGLAWCAA